MPSSIKIDPLVWAVEYRRQTGIVPKINFLFLDNLKTDISGSLSWPFIKSLLFCSNPDTIRYVEGLGSLYYAFFFFFFIK